jgi:uncharacterized protein (DUF885 family)
MPGRRDRRPAPLAVLATLALGTTVLAPLGGCAAARGDSSESWRSALVADRTARLAATPGGSAVDAFFLAYVEQRAALDPNFATRVGLHEHDDRLTRFDDSTWGRRQQAAAAALRVAARLDEAALTPAERTDLTLFTSQLLLELHEYARQDVRTVRPDLPLGGIAAVNDLLIRDFAPREERTAHAVARLAQIPFVCADIRARLTRPPALWTRMAIDDTAGALAFLDTVPALCGAPEAPLPAGLDAALDAARTALTDYRDFLQAEVLPRSDGDFAIGRREFEYRLHVGDLLDLDADRLLVLGREQFDLTLAQLEVTARQIDPARDWRALLAEMMADHPSAGELMETYAAELQRARQFLIDHAIVPIPDEKLQLRETPPFMRSTVPFAAYEAPAPLDSSRLGTFYVTPEPEAQIRSDIPGTTWHEAYPGHHLQLVYSKDNPSLVRRVNDSPLLSEGWGFYCEELASETGYYDDPRERLMQLNWKLQRAARVILDTSLHAFGMSYDDAVDFLVQRVGMRPEQARASVNAYTQSPTYFSSYVLGMLEIVRLREECRARLGARFTLSEFHARLLRCGNVPPALIETELAEWR